MLRSRRTIRNVVTLAPRHTLYCLLLLAASFAGLAAGCTRQDPGDGKIHLTYWDKWERFEGEAMKRVVRLFNERNPRIAVHYSSFGAIDRKVMTATAGGDPPDIAGMWASNVAPFADRSAIIPLDEYMQRDGITRDRWIDVFADICVHRGKMWAIPTTPATTGLFWNKALFREAGLDPERPPRTVEELDEFSRRLTRYDDQGNIIQMGFLPQEPGWFIWAFGPWFGGQLVTEEGINANDPRIVEAYEWIQSYSLNYGVDRIKKFASGFGPLSTPQNPFFSGKIAMVIQGVWMYNFISQFAPGMEWGAAAWPKAPHGAENFCTADLDLVVIPVGLPRERQDAAWEFLKFLCTQEAAEMLNLGQRKQSPLKEVSREFLAAHPNPAIEMFTELSKSRNVIHLPQLGMWNQYQSELHAAAERVRLLEINPATGKPYTAKETLDLVQQRIAELYDRHTRSLALRSPKAEEPS